MGIINKFIDLCDTLEKSMENLKIEEVFFPKNGGSDPNQRFNNFGAVKLNDNSIGIIFIGLSKKIKKNAQNFKKNTLKGSNPFNLLRSIKSGSLFKKILGFGVINAISQSFFRNVQFSFDFTTDSMGLLNLEEGDIAGMVGFFPPLIKRIKNKNIPLVVIEKKERLVQKHDNWEVTLDPSKLKECNKVLCTSSTLLNDSIDEILKYTKSADKLSIIGPTAGFIPDPLFKLNVNVIGGTYVSKPSLFMDLISQNKKWGPSTKKYCIQANNYPGVKKLLAGL
jgi:uncharacterized protein (DUF4213/DUF364 family)